MERHVKERLIGAAVLVALAVILIPELLSGPAERSAPAVVSKEGVKTYQFDLDSRDRPRAVSAAPATPRQGTPNSPAAAEEVSTPVPPQEASSTELVARPETKPEPRRPEVAARAEPARSVPASTEAAPSAAPAPTQRPPTAAAREKGWAIQLGSFADQQRAERLAERMRTDGYRSYIVPLQRSDSKVLHRVRVGPYPDEPAAQAAMKKLGDLAKGAALVSEK